MGLGQKTVRYNNPVDAEQIQKIAKALADPRRREILEIIARSENPDGIHCNAIVERVPISQPTVSHHVKELTGAGLIEIHPDGQYNRVTVRTDVLNEYLESLRDSLRPPAEK
jgi:ArsR family transcriptional regulator, arsenate/arsenite/antimonite-responsive transcriptional repressor